MPIPPDDTAYSEASHPRTPHWPGTDTGEEEVDLSRLIVRPTPFPGTMLATGVLWIFAGAVYVALFAFLRVFDVPFQSNDFWLIAGAVFYVKDGIELIRGQFRDPQLDGVISILLGLFFLGQGWVNFDEGAGVVWLLSGLFFGPVFLVPGILALLGRKKYLAWKAEQGIV